MQQFLLFLLDRVMHLRPIGRREGRNGQQRSGRQLRRQRCAGRIVHRSVGIRRQGVLIGDIRAADSVPANLEILAVKQQSESLASSRRE